MLVRGYGTLYNTVNGSKSTNITLQRFEMNIKMKTTVFTLILWSVSFVTIFAGERFSVPKDHPRLFGDRARIETLAAERPQEFARMKSVAENKNAGEHARMFSISLLNAVEPNPELAREAVDLAMKRIDGQIIIGHQPFGTVLAECAVVFDYCYDYWTEAERSKFVKYFNETVKANVNEETHVFHNGWYGYKNWGYGIAAYATYYENPKSPKLLDSIEKEYENRAAPALELSGKGGGFAEGYYVNYWIYEWTLFCEIAGLCEGVDYFEKAPGFFRERAIAGMFEMYPGIGIYGSRRPIPIGDGGGRVFGGDRDKTLNSRRILVNHYKNDPAHQYVHAFNELTPRASVGDYAFMDFLFHYTKISKVDLSKFKLSHYSPGPGYIYSRSSWEEDAVYFFFKCGNRFTAHQHLDVGNFLIYKHEELIGDGGHYDGFGTSHDVNYHLRTIAHNTLRIVDPNETWEVKHRDPIRAGKVTSNDGGQRYDWPQHNGAVSDAEEWTRKKEIYETGNILEFKDFGDHVFIKADCTKAYSPKKVKSFVRTVVYLRPGTFIVLDRLEITDPEFKAIWNLQAMKQPEKVFDESGNELLTLCNGKGRLYIRTLSPEKVDTKFFHGEELYKIDGIDYRPERDADPAPECRIEIVPLEKKKDHVFVHVLYACETEEKNVPEYRLEIYKDTMIIVLENDRTFKFETKN